MYHTLGYSHLNHSGAMVRFRAALLRSTARPGRPKRKTPSHVAAHAAQKGG